MKKLGLGILIAGLGISAVGVTVLLTSKVKKTVDVDIEDVDINICSDVDKGVDITDSLKKTVNSEPVIDPIVEEASDHVLGKIIKSDAEMEEDGLFRKERISPLSDEAMKDPNVWDPNKPMKVMTAEELDRLGKVNPLE